MATTKTKKTKDKKDKEKEKDLPAPYYHWDAFPYMEAGQDFQITLNTWQVEEAKGLKYLARAIHRSSSLESVSILNLQKISPSDMEELVEVLYNHKTITKLEVKNVSPTDAEYRLLSNVLKKTNRITTVELHCAELSMASATMLAEALKVNTSLDNLKFIATKLDVPKLKILAEGLKVHPKIHTTGYYSETLDNECSKVILAILEANPRVKSIEFSRSLGDFTALAEFMKSNTSLAKIGFYEITAGRSMELFCQGLAANKGIKEFTIQGEYSFWNYDACTNFAKALSLNTALQIFNGNNKNLNAEHIRLLSKGLAENNTLKVLNFRENNLNAVIDKTRNPEGEPTGTGAFCAALKNNTSITSIDISRNKLYERGYVDIAALLKENKGIRKLHMDLFIGHTTIDESLRLICESLKVNTTLTELKLYECVKFSNQAWSHIKAMLKVNKALSHLEIPYVDIPEKIQRKVKKNKRRREKGIRYAKMLIRMIALRPAVYSTVLPIEIWAYVMRYYTVPGVDIDFEKEFLAQINK